MTQFSDATDAAYKALGDAIQAERAAVVPPVVPVPPASTSHEPASFLPVVDWACDVVRPQGTGFSSSYTGAIVTASDPTAPKSPPTIVRQNFTSALPGGSSPAIVDFNFAGKRGLYISAYLKWSLGMVGHPSLHNKLIYGNINGGLLFYLMNYGAGTGKLTPAVCLQGIAQPYNDGRGLTAKTVDLLPNQPNAPSIVRGAWPHYEVLLTGNTAGQADGAVSVWVDGVAALNYSGIAWTPGAGLWQGLQFSPQYGGSGGQITAPFSLDADHIYASAG